MTTFLFDGGRTSFSSQKFFCVDDQYLLKRYNQVLSFSSIQQCLSVLTVLLVHLHLVNTINVL